MKFKRQYYDDFPSVGEPGGGEVLVDSAGYITAEQQIFSMINAGIRLDQSRREMYDYEGNDDDVDFESIPSDALRHSGIDMAEVSQMQLSVKERLKRQKIYAEKLKKEAMESAPEKEEKKE